MSLNLIKRDDVRDIYQIWRSIFFILKLTEHKKCGKNVDARQIEISVVNANPFLGIPILGNDWQT